MSIYDIYTHYVHQSYSLNEKKQIHDVPSNFIAFQQTIQLLYNKNIYITKNRNLPSYSITETINMHYNYFYLKIDMPLFHFSVHDFLLKSIFNVHESNLYFFLW